MRKYYISSGDLNVVIMARTGIEAAALAFTRFGEGKELAEDGYFCVDERGFKDYLTCMLTYQVSAIMAYAGKNN